MFTKLYVRDFTQTLLVMYFFAAIFLVPSLTLPNEDITIIGKILGFTILVYVLAQNIKWVRGIKKVKKNVVEIVIRNLDLQANSLEKKTGTTNIDQLRLFTREIVMVLETRLYKIEHIRARYKNQLPGLEINIENYTKRDHDCWLHVQYDNQHYRLQIY